jgi:hypothetical protein
MTTYSSPFDLERTIIKSKRPLRRGDRAFTSTAAWPKSEASAAKKKEEER